MILFITYAVCGGAERISLLYAKILRQAGYHCHLLIIQKDGMEFSLKSFIPNDLPYDLLQCRRFYSLFQLLYYVNRHRPVCIFDSMSGTPMGMLRICLKKLFPHIKIVFRECNMPSRRTKTQQFITGLSLKKIDAIISQTEEMRQEMSTCYTFPARRITVIHNPLDEIFIQDKTQEAFRFAEPGGIHYLAVGRIVPQKDYLTLLKAFAIVVSQQPRSRLHILGDCNFGCGYKKLLDETVRALNLEKTVLFEGFQENPYKYMKAADVFVLSSLYEGLPNVMLEAMYLGLPVVATRCIPYISRAVAEGKNGYIVPVENPKAMAEAMMKAISLHKYEPQTHTTEKKTQIMNLFNKVLTEI